jgi:hypothetical protein
MIEKGVIGSLLTGMGTASYTEVQNAAIQLLLLIHELSPDCSIALSYLLPKKFLLVFLVSQPAGPLPRNRDIKCSIQK